MGADRRSLTWNVESAGRTDRLTEARVIAESDKQNSTDLEELWDSSRFVPRGTDGRMAW